MNYYLLKKTPSKARRDVDQIMRDMNFRNIGFNRLPGKNAIMDFLITLFGVLKAPFVLKKGDILCLPYNLRKYYLFLCRAAHIRGSKVVTLIHDISSFYRPHITSQQDIHKLNHSDYIIAHNPRMKQWLLDNGCKVPVGVLGIFDYLSSKEPTQKGTPKQPYSILYAGTLSPQKNKFLYKLDEHIHSFRFNLYGKGFDIDQIKRKEYFNYKGFVASDDLVAAADGDFGLVWDGSSIHSCEGLRGEYMKYNNPHKCSLYIRSGLPLIIWEKAAMADFVRENNIGLSVSSLTQLDEILSSVDEERYIEMKRNVDVINKRLSDGYYFKTAFQEALRSINS